VCEERARFSRAAPLLPYCDWRHSAALRRTCAYACVHLRLCARLRAHANIRNVRKQYNLAICYLYGYGVAPNHTAAFAWLNASANWDNPAAHVMLGTRYRDGQGVPQDFAKAYYHLDKASKLGEVEALISLGVMLLDASYYEPNCRVAHKALKIAAERGPWGQIVKEGYDAYAAGDKMGAFVRYRLAAELGYRTAQVALASICAPLHPSAPHSTPPYWLLSTLSPGRISVG